MKAENSLHRSGKKPDWAKISRRRWSVWQRLAGGSGGILTPGNLITLGGFALVMVGLLLLVMETYWLGLVCVAAGRLCDLADGWLADRTKTKSPLGEMLDSTADKLETVTALAVLVVIQLLPVPAALLVLVPQLALGLLSFTRWHRGRRLHPSRLGKLSMAFAWSGLIIFILVAASGWLADGSGDGAAYGLCIASALLAGLALVAYQRER